MTTISAPFRNEHSWIWWCFNGLCQWPATLQSASDRSKRYTYVSRFDGVGKRHGLSVVIDKSVIALVAVLNFRCRPFAVPRFVVAVPVFSFNAVIRGWPLSHVFKKVHERFKPSVADLDAASTVSVPSSTSRTFTGATHPHVNPNAPFRTAAQIVCGGPFGDLFGSQATARLGGTVSKRKAVRECMIAAIAKAIPSGVPVAIVCPARLYDKARVALSDFIFQADNLLRWVFSFGHADPVCPKHQEKHDAIKKNVSQCPCVWQTSEHGA